MADDVEVQVKFRAPKYLKELIDRATEKDVRVRTANAWLVLAVIERLEAQGFRVERKAARRG